MPRLRGYRRRWGSRSLGHVLRPARAAVPQRRPQTRTLAPGASHRSQVAPRRLRRRDHRLRRRSAILSGRPAVFELSGLARSATPFWARAARPLRETCRSLARWPRRAIRRRFGRSLDRHQARFWNAHRKEQSVKIRVATLAMLASCALVSGLPALGQEDQPEPPAGVNPMPALAQPSGTGRTGPRVFHRSSFEPGHVAWVAVAAIGTLLVAPGWLFLYAGRAGNRAPSRAAAQLVLLATLLSLTWGLITYSLAFGFNWGAASARESELVGSDGQFTGLPLIGGTRHMALAGLEPDVAADEHEYPLRRRQDAIPHILFMTWQMLVALIAPVPMVVVLSNRLKTG